MLLPATAALAGSSLRTHIKVPAFRRESPRKERWERTVFCLLVPLSDGHNGQAEARSLEVLPLPLLAWAHLQGAGRDNATRN